MTYADYLATMTVKTLREVAARMGVKGQNLRARKADLINHMDDLISIGHLSAMPVVTPVNTEIQFGKGWNCCAERPAKVVVFDNGARWAVCKSCASVYAGEVQELPVENVVEPERVSVSDFLSLRSLALVKGYKLRNKPLAVYKDGFMAMDFTSVAKCRAWLDMHADDFTLAELLNKSAQVNLSIAHKAKAMMISMGEQHPSFDVAVQVHKDALNAYEEARRTALYL